MMTGSHPSDLELLEYSEGELDETAAEAVRTHLETCAACAATVAAADRGRELLRASPLAELPEDRWQVMLRDLPPQEPGRSRWQAFLSSPRRMATVLAPVAVAAVAVVVVVTTTGDEKARKQAGDAAVAAQTAAAQAAPEAGGAQEDFEAARAPVVMVKGPPRAVAKLLRAEGFRAKVVDGAVEVRGAKRAQVRAALRDRPGGPVAVFVAR